MRVLATMRGHDLPTPTVNPFLHDEDWGHGLVYRFDPDPELDARAADHGWIGNDADGVWVTEHPLESLATRCPDLGDVVLEHWRGIRKPALSDMERLTERESQAKLALYSAFCRERDRAIKAKTGDQS